MPVKKLTHPTTGQTLYLGRNQPPAGFPRLTFGDYTTANPLPPAPDCDYTTAAMQTLSEMFLNDAEGDCVIACLAHFFGTLNENAGANKSLFSDAEINNEYTLIGGFDPNAPLINGVNPTDNGCDEVTALNHVLQYGFKGHRMVNGEKIKHDHHADGWLLLDGSNKEQIRQAAWLFENLIFAIELPDEWIAPFPSGPGFIWDVAGPSDPYAGHSFLGCKTSHAGIGIIPWGGMIGTMTYAAVSEYTAGSDGGALYTAVSAESLNRAQQKAPNGMDWPTLITDFKNFALASKKSRDSF